MFSVGHWQFDFSNPWLIGLTVLLLISLLLSFHAVAKRLFHRAPLRAMVVMLVNIIAFGVVLLLLLEPRFLQAVEQSSMLVTEGVDLTDIRSTDIANLYIAPGVITSAEERQDLVAAHWLLDVTQMELRDPSLSSVEVRGFGLDPEQWQGFSRNFQVEFEPPAIYGFTRMRWQRSLVEGETLSLKGRYRHTGTGAIAQLRLLDPADNVVDETRVKNGHHFQLTARVKARGHLEYSLQAWSGDTLLSEQAVPFEAGTGNGLNIMIEQSAPSFETRALKNYAAVNGHRLLLSTVVSKDKIITQSVNLPAKTDSKFSPVMLAGQDMLVMDGRAIMALTPLRRQWLEDAVEAGLGLLVLADSALLNGIAQLETGLLNGFQLSSLAGTEPAATPHLLTGNPGPMEEPVPVAALQLSADDADILIDDGKGRSLVIRRAKGLGNISISLISHSHNWLTAGQQADWGKYWSTLFSRIARQRAGSYLIPQAQTAFYTVNKRVAVCALAAEEGSSILINAVDSPVYQSAFELQLAADQQNSPRQCSYFWPKVSGWHRVQLLSSEGDSVFDQKAFYVFEPDQWLSQQRDQRVHATRARQMSGEALSEETAAEWKSEPLDLFWLWLTLVLSCSFLWLERKLHFAWSDQSDHAEQNIS